MDQAAIGSWIPISGGQRAFVPAPAPRALALSAPLVMQLDRASRAVATLSGVGETLPNPHLLIRPFARREAVLSSKLEGTQTSLPELLLFEIDRAQIVIGRSQIGSNTQNGFVLRRGLRQIAPALRGLRLRMKLLNLSIVGRSQMRLRYGKRDQRKEQARCRSTCQSRKHDGKLAYGASGAFACRVVDIHRTA